MNKENKTEKRRKLSALDVFIVLLMLMCAAGVIVRLYVGTDGLLPTINTENEEYNVSFEIVQERSPVGGYLVSGDSLYFEDGTLFGTISDNVTVTPAKLFCEDAEGKYVQIYSGAENGDNNLVDIKGTAGCEGYETDYGFLVGGKTYISPNYELTLHTNRVTVKARITDISKAND